jgi:nicotinamide mononucleotide transporter
MRVTAAPTSSALNPAAAQLIEALAFALALGYVIASIRLWHWGWPLMAASSVLYGVLFADARLYGQMALQAFFVAAALWGWWQWLHGMRGDQPLAVALLPLRARVLLGAGWLLAWGIGGSALLRLTDSEVPFFDVFPTVGSVLGQVLTARKYVEAWVVWLVVNVVSVALFLQQRLWLTALLYAILVALSLVGWREWKRSMARRVVQ